MALKLGIILWTLHLCRHYFELFWMILLKNAMGRKFHHNYSQSEATNQRYRCKDGCSPNNARQGERVKHAGLLPPRPPGQWRLLRVPPVAHATRYIVGRYGAATAAAGPAEPAAVAAVAAAAATRQDKARQLTYFRRYSGDTLKWKKRTPRHQSPSSFQYNHISKFQKGKTQHNPIPNGTDTLGKFQTCKNAGKSINNQNHVFQTQAGRRTHRLPQFFPPN